MRSAEKDVATAGAIPIRKLLLKTEPDLALRKIGKYEDTWVEEKNLGTLWYGAHNVTWDRSPEREYGKPLCADMCIPDGVM